MEDVKKILEADEKDDAAEDTDGGAYKNDDAQSAVAEIDQPFSGLDLRSARCFGYSMPKDKCWKCIADQAEDVGWELVDKQQLEKSLAKDVEHSYLRIADFKLVNVDDDMAYSLSFDNNKAMWTAQLLDSPKAEISTEELADFFKSEMFKKIAKKTYYRVLNAQKTYDKDVKRHLENGELMLVDTVKLDAILHFLSLDYFLKNVLEGKYVK